MERVLINELNIKIPNEMVYEL